MFFVRLFPNYISSWDLASRHVAGANLVMRQYPSSSSKDGFKLDSSFLSNEEVIRFGTIGLALEQTAGFETIDNKDDKFLKVENSRKFRFESSLCQIVC